MDLAVLRDDLPLRVENDRRVVHPLLARDPLGNAASVNPDAVLLRLVPEEIRGRSAGDVFRVLIGTVADPDVVRHFRHADELRPLRRGLVYHLADAFEVGGLVILRIQLQKRHVERTQQHHLPSVLMTHVPYVVLSVRGVERFPEAFAAPHRIT